MVKKLILLYKVSVNDVISVSERKRKRKFKTFAENPKALQVLEANVENYEGAK